MLTLESRDKRKRVLSPAPAAPATTKELLQHRLNGLVSERHDMSEFFQDLAQPSNFYPMFDPVLVDASGVPRHWLPDEFSRRVVGGETRLVFGKNLVSPETTAHVHACVQTTAIAGTAYYLGEDGYALVIPRSSTDPTGISFEHKRIKFTTGDDQQLDLLRLVSSLLRGRAPSASKALYLVAGLRDIHRATHSKAVLAALSVPPGTDPHAHLATLLDSTERHVPSLASNLLACAMTDDLLNRVLSSAERGEVEVQVLYNIVSGIDLSLPLRSFSKGQGYDQAGRPLEEKKLSECGDEEAVITSTKIVTLQNFRSLTDASSVFIMPTDGLYRKGPRRDKRDTFVEMTQVTTSDALTLRRYARAVQGAKGTPHVKQAEEQLGALDALEEEEL